MEGSDPPSKSLSPVASPPPDSVGQKVAQLESELKTNVKPAAGATSAEERCPICLEDFEDKAFIDACFHILYIYISTSFRPDMKNFEAWEVFL